MQVVPSMFFKCTIHGFEYRVIQFPTAARKLEIWVQPCLQCTTRVLKYSLPEEEIEFCYVASLRIECRLRVPLDDLLKPVGF